ncbi:MAG: ABC transporter transmembrane domain-containing protein, partial [Eubacteriales bacterium]|nr:ABC transporter transmembrane domain-containing protein [Eubacteriales bacterium]
MRSVFSFLKPYRRHLVIGPAFKLAEAVLELAMPLLIAYMIDTGIESQDRTLIWRLGLLALLMAVTGLGCATVCQYTASLASQGVGTDLRHALFSKINHLSLRQLDHFGTSSLVNRLTGDVNLLQQAVAMLIRLVVRAPFLSIGGLIMAMTIDLRLSLILLLILPIFILIVYLIMSWTIPKYRKIQQVVDRLMRHIVPTIYISALIDIEEISRAFDLGCFDYLKKPFHLKELTL